MRLLLPVCWRCKHKLHKLKRTGQENAAVSAFPWSTVVFQLLCYIIVGKLPQNPTSSVQPEQGDPEKACEQQQQNEICGEFQKAVQAFRSFCSVLVLTLLQDLFFQIRIFILFYFLFPLPCWEARGCVETKVLLSDLKMVLRCFQEENSCWKLHAMYQNSIMFAWVLLWPPVLPFRPNPSSPPVFLSFSDACLTLFSDG